VSASALRSRGPSGPPRSGKSGKNGSTSVETTGHLSVRVLRRQPCGRQLHRKRTNDQDHQPDDDESSERPHLATIALRGSAKRARSGLCRRRPFAEPWPERPAAKRQERKKWRSANRARSGLCRRRPFAEPWPERPAAKWQERRKWRSANRAHPVCVGEGRLRSRGPSGPPRSGKSGKMAPLLSRRPVTYRCALSRVIGDPPAVRRRTSQIPGWG